MRLALQMLLRPWRNLATPNFGGSSGPPPTAVPVTPPAPLFPGLANTISQQGPGAINTATQAYTNAASGVDVNQMYKSVVEASKNQEATGRANIMSSMGASGMATSSDAMKSTADYETNFQANLLSQLQQMQFQNEAIKMGGAQGLMDTYGNAALAFAPTEEIMGTSAGPSVFSQVAGATTGAATAAAMLLMAMCWISAELYGGWNSQETYTLRYYITTRQSWRGKGFRFLYVKFGQRVAAHIRTHKLSRRVVKMLFDRIFAKAFSWRLSCHNQA